MKYYDIYQFSQAVGARSEEIEKMEKEGFWECVKKNKDGKSLYEKGQLEEFEAAKKSYDSYIAYIAAEERDRTVVNVSFNNISRNDLNKMPDISKDEPDFASYLPDEEEDIEIERTAEEEENGIEADNNTDETELTERKMADENLREREAAQAQAETDLEKEREAAIDAKKKKIKQQEREKTRREYGTHRQEGYISDSKTAKALQNKEDKSVKAEEVAVIEEQSIPESYNNQTDSYSIKYHEEADSEHYSKKENMHNADDALVAGDGSSFYKSETNMSDFFPAAQPDPERPYEGQTDAYNIKNNEKSGLEHYNNKENSYNESTTPTDIGHDIKHNAPGTDKSGYSADVKHNFNAAYQSQADAHYGQTIRHEQHISGIDKVSVSGDETAASRQSQYHDEKNIHEQKNVKAVEPSNQTKEQNKLYELHKYDFDQSKPEKTKLVGNGYMIDDSKDSGSPTFKATGTDLEKIIVAKTVDGNPSIKDYGLAKQYIKPELFINKEGQWTTAQEGYKKHFFNIHRGPAIEALRTDDYNILQDKYEKRQNITRNCSNRDVKGVDRNIQELILKRYGKTNFIRPVEEAVYTTTMIAAKPILELKNTDTGHGAGTASKAFDPFLKAVSRRGNKSAYRTEMRRFRRNNLSEFNDTMHKYKVISSDRILTMSNKNDLKEALRNVDRYFKKRGILRKPITSLSRHEIGRILADNGGKKYKMFTADDKAVLRMLYNKRGHGLYAIRDADGRCLVGKKNLRSAKNRIIDRFTGRTDFVRGYRFTTRTINQVYKITSNNIRTMVYLGKGLAYGIRKIKHGAEVAIKRVEATRLAKKINVLIDKTDGGTNRRERITERNRRREGRNQSRKDHKEAKSRKRNSKIEKKEKRRDRRPTKRLKVWAQNTKLGKAAGAVTKVLNAPFRAFNIVKMKIKKAIFKIIVVVGGAILLLNLLSMPMLALSSYFENMFGFSKGDSKTDTEESPYGNLITTFENQNNQWFSNMKSSVSKMKPSNSEISSYDSVNYIYMDGNGNRIRENDSNTKDILCMGHVYLQYDISTDERQTLLKQYMQALFNASHTYETKENVTYCSGCKTKITYCDGSCQSNIPGYAAGYAACPGHITTYCPGHASLTVTVKVYGLTGTNSLYSIDTIGSAVNNVEDWNGWTDETKSDVAHFYEGDWKEMYDIDIS